MGLVAGLTPAKRGRRLPVVLSVSEVRLVLSRMRGVPRLCASLMYGSGMRLSECTALRVKDIDFDRSEIMVRAGKGDKDRRVPMPRLTSPALKIQIERVRKQFERDLRSGVMGSPLRSAPRAIPCAILSRRISWKAVLTFERSRSYSATVVFRRR